ncbi:MAG TPA: tetraacyldisaccharide 4'-kinase [Candidimonas sp.]|nr:tetraacyldisaccharide 4'-kinase [Candidimonas sp.]
MKAPVSLTKAVHAAWLHKGLLSTVLLPLSWPVHAVIAWKHARFRDRPDLAYHSRLPVVVVGNVYVGGTGKTPVVIALTQALQQRGWHPGIVSRGYGAAVGEQPRIGRGLLDPAQFGDEPALIAQATQAPVAVHPDRGLAVKRLHKSHPEVDIVISDDGLQHLALGRDLEIVVQDARGIGNGRVMPAGPLREPASRLAYVDFIITNMQPGQAAPDRASTLAHQLSMYLKPVSLVQLTTGREQDWPAWLAEHGGQPIAAVAAIGQPQRFFSMLSDAGIKLEAAVALPDHDTYEKSPFTALTSPHILITAKDAVKCRKFNDARLWVVHAAPVFSDPEWLDLADQLLRIIAAKKTRMADKTHKH